MPSYTEGMTLRDYFAGQALVGILAHAASRWEIGETPESVAQCAYQVADAMLAQGDKGDAEANP